MLWGVMLLVVVSRLGAQNAKSGDAERRSQSVQAGKTLFKQNCASCHGDDAKGGGPAAVALKTQPPDLTRLASRKNGKFPYEEVRKTIAGDSAVPAHGTREMPTWGPLFLAMTAENQKAADQRITNLADYLKSIQAK
jgi:mono/diheme cytochrome c family protein